MKIMENKRVSLIVLVVLILFGGICYHAYERYQAFQQAAAEIADNRNKLEEYANEDFSPTKENSKQLVAASDAMEKLEVRMRKGLESYVKKSEALSKDDQGNPMPPTLFQKAVNDMTAKVASYAAEKQCKLSAGAATLGLNEYKTAPATQRDAPYLNYLLHAADTLVRHVTDSGSPSITRFYCAPLQAEVLDKFEKQKKPGSYFPMELEIGFVARRSAVDIDPAAEETLSVLPKVINKLVKDKDFFYVVTGVSVKTPGNLPVLSPYRAASNVVVEDPMKQPTEGEEGAPKPPAAEPAARQITGDAEQETVDVSITLQVLYFMSVGDPKGKK